MTRLEHLYVLREQIDNAIVSEFARIEREQGRLPRARRTDAARHGTDSGYHTHRKRWKTDPCAACRMAHAAAERSRVSKLREAS